LNVVQVIDENYNCFEELISTFVTFNR